MSFIALQYAARVGTPLTEILFSALITLTSRSYATGCVPDAFTSTFLSVRLFIHSFAEQRSFMHTGSLLACFSL